MKTLISISYFDIFESLSVAERLELISDLSGKYTFGEDDDNDILVKWSDYKVFFSLFLKYEDWNKFTISEYFPETRENKHIIPLCPRNLLKSLGENLGSFIKLRDNNLYFVVPIISNSIIDLIDLNYSSYEYRCRIVSASISQLPILSLDNYATSLHYCARKILTGKLVYSYSDEFIEIINRRFNPEIVKSQVYGL